MLQFVEENEIYSIVVTAWWRQRERERKRRRNKSIRAAAAAAAVLELHVCQLYGASPLSIFILFPLLLHGFRD